jgi:hypothetical protein
MGNEELKTSKQIMRRMNAIEDYLKVHWGGDDDEFTGSRGASGRS